MKAEQKKIVLATANARYSHTSLALRSLLANLREFEKDAVLLEFTITDRPADAAEAILSREPRFVLLSVYLWNAVFLNEVASIIRAVAPAVTIVLGGPEVSFEDDLPPVAQWAHHIIAGEGELLLPALLAALAAGRPFARFTRATPPDLSGIALPLRLYTDEDIRHRVLYVESSRGCAFGCEFCLSCLTDRVRFFDPVALMPALEDLWNRGARKFKFIDRTIHAGKAERILRFFLDRNVEGLFVHFEIVPDHLTDPLFDLLAKFPSGAVQLEAGVQTFDPEVAARVGRKQDMDRTLRNLQRLIATTGVHIHSDLVAGLPGETMAGFADGFNRLLATGVHEIQVGILKRLRGAPIDRHTAAFEMVYRNTPPYDVLQNRDIPFADMQRLKRFARFFDLVFNSGNFRRTAPSLWAADTPFNGFMRFSDWMHDAVHNTADISLDRLATLIFRYRTEILGHATGNTADGLLADFVSAGRTRFPACVREAATVPLPTGRPGRRSALLPPRQERRKGGVQ